jgi:F-type H+-transporting ATPase subunit gamma
MRIVATSNIAKITKSMKMVSAAKMRGAENRLMAGRPFVAWLDNTSGKHRIVEKDGVVPKEELEGENNLFFVVSTDRGLCGGINSGIAKTVRKQFAAFDRANSDVIVLGDKGRAQLRRDFADVIRASATEAYANPPTFTVASAIAELVIGSARENEKVHVVYNKFISAIAYLPSVRSLAVSPTSEDWDQYELEPEDKNELLADLKEFEIATAIFHGIVENSTSEESSRMAAMENATNNAQDLIQSLTLVYNKARQSRITTELIEIISGAASLDG